MRLRYVPTACTLLGVLGALAACSHEHPTRPGLVCGPAASSALRPGGAGVNLVMLSNGGSLAPLQGTVVSAAALANCVTLAGDSGTYIVVPQYATGSGPQDSVPYEVGTAPAASLLARIAQPAADAARGMQTLQQQLDGTLRRAEHRLAPAAPAALERWRLERTRINAVSLPPVGSTRSFYVLADLNGNTFVTDTASLRYIGTNIMIYVDQNAPPPPVGFTDAQLAAFGEVFDQELYAIDVRTFGPPSDIDGNGHVIVLMTPIVNRLTTPAQCTTVGYVAGFFYGLDLMPSSPNSNAAEIFYSLVPDANGQFSCAHPQSDVDRTTPATFIHEFQHMISWNQHVILRHGLDEQTWLNEGMSHIAEEMGSRYYENKYPPPLDRTNPQQLFPDSAEGFISGDLVNSYNYLLNPTAWSITEFIQGGVPQERGGVWLFLRWLGDQIDSTIYRKLEQTSLTGITNVEAQAGEKFPSLFGDFSLALYTDSLPGVPRDAIPASYRFRSRNLRTLYAALFRADPDRGRVPRPFPIMLKTLAAPSTDQSSMVPGTTDFFRVQLPNDGVSEMLQFAQPNGAPFNAGLGAQLSVFRCPPAVCQ